MKLKNAKNFLKCGLFAFLFVMAVASAVADPARVVSKQENMPHGNNNLKTRIFLDITPDDDNHQADAYMDIYMTNRIMPNQEFSDMIQVGDMIEYIPNPHARRDGRYTAINNGDLISLNGDNVYRIFVVDLEDSFGIAANAYLKARQAYEAQQRR